MPLREDAGDRERMRDVGLAGLAELSLVGLFAEVISRLQLRDVLRLEIAGPVLEQRSGGGLHEGWGPSPPGSGLALVENLGAVLARGQLAQGNHGGLVAARFHHRLRAVGNLARAVS